MSYLPVIRGGRPPLDARPGDPCAVAPCVLLESSAAEILVFWFLSIRGVPSRIVMATTAV